MDERIKELAWKAKIGLPSDNTYTRTFITSSDNVEEFAELLIEKCANIADNCTKLCDSPGDIIREYFGAK